MDILEKLNYLLESGRTPNHEETCSAIAEIVRLRARAGAVSDGQSFGDVRAAIAASIAADA